MTNTLNATSDGILIVSYLPQGETITLSNPRFGELFGIDYHVVIGQPDEMVRAEAQKSFKDPAAFQRDQLFRESEKMLRRLIGEDLILQKPFTPQTLGQKVREILDRAQNLQ